MTGKKIREHYYWDSCIFLALLIGESHRAGEMEEICRQATLFESGEIALYTSAISITEVIGAGKLSVEQGDRFNRILQRSNFIVLDATPDICKLASEIRSYFTNNKINQNGHLLYPSAPDSIQIASAIHAQLIAGEHVPLLTFDTKNKPKIEELALVKCSPYTEKVHNLCISRPNVDESLGSELTLPFPSKT